MSVKQSVGNFISRSRASGTRDMEPRMPFHQLPVLVVTSIMGYVPLRDKLNIMNVSRDWARLIRSISSLWKHISIDKSSTFGGDWKEINAHNWLLKSLKDFKDPSEHTKDLEELLSQLTRSTDSIQHFKIEVPEYVLQERTLVKLLTKQKKLLSLSLCFMMCRPKNFKGQLLEIIKMHQNTLECIDVSMIGITFQQWHRYLKDANFPSLKKISYPMSFSDQDVDQFLRSYNTKDKETLRQCFMQTLEHGKIEEINMNTCDYEAFMMGWTPVIANPLKDQILQGKTRKLRKIHLDSLFVNDVHTGNNLDNIADDIDTFMRQCPELTHLKGHFCRGTIPSEQLGKLIRHYNSQIIHIQCEVNNTIAELISNSCMNLTALAVSGCNELSDKSLLAFCKLLKLEKLHLKINNKDSITGLTTLLSSCLCNLKELSLELPWNFYNETKLYSSISHGCSVLKSLSLSNSGEAEQIGYTGRLDGIHNNTFVKGLLQIISARPPLKSLNLQLEHVFDDYHWDEETIRNVLQGIIKYLPMLSTLIMYIEGMFPTYPFLMNYLIDSMPYCQIRISEWD